MLGLDTTTGYCVQNQPARQQQEAEQHQGYAQDRGWKARHQACFQIGLQQRYGQHDRQRGTEQEADRKEQQWTLGLEQLHDGGEDAPPVTPGIQLALRTLRPHTVDGADFGDRHAQLQRVHRQLGFGFESMRMRGIGLDVAARDTR